MSRGFACSSYRARRLEAMQGISGGATEGVEPGLLLIWPGERFAGDGPSSKTMEGQGRGKLAAICL